MGSTPFGLLSRDEADSYANCRSRSTEPAEGRLCPNCAQQSRCSIPCSRCFRHRPTDRFPPFLFAATLAESVIGTSLGPYKIIEQLGAGGMSEVYLGEDTRLGRKVTIKALPAEFASDPERLARFEQEARAAAALNHPHIAAVFDVGPGFKLLRATSSPLRRLPACARRQDRIKIRGGPSRDSSVLSTAYGTPDYHGSQCHGGGIPTVSAELDSPSEERRAAPHEFQLRPNHLHTTVGLRRRNRAAHKEQEVGTLHPLFRSN